MRLRLHLATVEQASAISELRLAVAARLNSQFGRGPWSRSSSVRGVLFDLHRSVLYVATRRGRVIATLALCTRKPWSVDRQCFSPSPRPLYLLSLAVAPDYQGQGIGRSCLAEAERLALAWPADALRLDTYDAPAGARGFYHRCGFVERGRSLYRGVPLIFFEKSCIQNPAVTVPKVKI